MNTIFFCGFFLSALACANSAPSPTIRQHVLAESNPDLPMAFQDSSTTRQSVTTVDTETKKDESIITAANESEQLDNPEGGSLSKSEYLVPRDLEVGVNTHQSKHSKVRQGRQHADTGYDYESAQLIDGAEGEFLFKK
ncbi:uncharacterized protein LOC135835572 [Planococcus citri]|uniref:uncharacterized protein LOC135835572 n=1 Tax=Planococcus citri TaxID=170843 RepID=UPI0031F77DA3